jgi:hypothetical protein
VFLYITMGSQFPQSQAGSSIVNLKHFLGLNILIAVRWILTTTWFLLILVFLFVGLSLFASLTTGAWHWFQRSGAIMVSIGAVLSTRQPLRLILDSMIKGRHSLATGEKQSGAGYLNQIKTCVCGFLMVAMGTLIWAYGDLLGCLIYWDKSCLV